MKMIPCEDNLVVLLSVFQAENKARADEIIALLSEINTNLSRLIDKMETPNA